MCEIFVFGSNLRGRHGKGAALQAVKYYGAIYGQGVGRQGDAYAIPTKDGNLFPLPLAEIARHVAIFLDYANRQNRDRFHVTAIGCGLAGYTPQQIAPLFEFVPSNVFLPQEFKEALKHRPHAVPSP